MTTSPFQPDLAWVEVNGLEKSALLIPSPYAAKFVPEQMILMSQKKI
jgi:hypothetical protein